MGKQGQKFIMGAVANGIDKTLALNLFRLLVYFANYGFNKSHAIAYSSLVTSYLKTNHPLEFKSSIRILCSYHEH